MIVAFGDFEGQCLGTVVAAPKKM